MNGLVLAFLALIPLIAGTAPHDASSDAITVALCNGGEITIDLGLSDRDEDTQTRDCEQKGCHAGNCREKEKTKTKRSV